MLYMNSQTKQIQITPSDLLVRPKYNPDGTIDGWFALPATDFADGSISPAPSEIQPTPQEAVKAYLAERSPEFEAETLARGLIATWAGGYNSDKHFESLVEKLSATFPKLSSDAAESVARKCESEWSRQQRKR
jgi:hypothetical protein